MDTMSIVRTPIARQGDLIIREGPFTIADRDALPDDGYRHELLDGVLVMTPPPNIRHQDIALNLGLLLKQHAPVECKVMLAPIDVRLGARTSIEPDVVVARRADMTPTMLPAAPLLAVEVASPSTRTIDLGRKRELLAAAGCPSYWTIEPSGPELTAWTLHDGEYIVEARISGSETWTATHPFAVTVTPVDLLDD